MRFSTIHNFSLRSALFVTILFASFHTYATHNRAGELTFKQISKHTFEITLITYTHAKSMAADRAEVEIFWGDTTSEIVKRQSQTPYDPSTDVLKNVYVARHTYPGPGSYIVRFFDPNRIADIINISTSVSIPFYIETLLYIDPKLGFNNSPVLPQPPIDFACVGKVFEHNPNAYDPDGDSLVFTLIPPKRDVGMDVPGYFTPPAKTSFSLDPFTGELVWDQPINSGIYNIAILIEEYRNGRRIGYVIRDMQIIVRVCTNNPPIIKEVADTCVEPGKNIVLEFEVEALDTNFGDIVTLTASGGPFLQQVSKAVMLPDPASGKNYVTAKFSWSIMCEHIRKQPYRIVFRAVDDDETVPLTDLEHFDIKIVGPAPDNLQISPSGNGVNLKWEKPTCQNVRGYIVYRRADSSGWDPDYCETGAPPYTGFVPIHTIYSPDTLSYYDNNDGYGLAQGIRYCYRVTALYLNEGQYEFAEGYASNEECAKLMKDVPVITHVSVETTSASNGKIFIGWSKPTEIDTLQNPGPYTYELMRAEGIGGGVFNKTATFTSTSFSGLNDSSHVDSMLNTVSQPYTYRIDFYGTRNGSKYIIGRTVLASSTFLSIVRAHKRLDLSWDVKVPWRNTYYVVLRKNDTTGQWDSIAYTPNKYYADTGLENGKQYCYKIKDHGTYMTGGFTDPLINFSQEVCTTPRDSVRPCPVVLNAEGDCDGFKSNLLWAFTDSCSMDVTAYKIYFSPLLKNEFVHVGTVEGHNTLDFTDIRPDLQYSMAGCYVVTSVDSFGNESAFSNSVCVDNCPEYELPNVFSPDGDDINDVLSPLLNSRFVESIEIQIFNRWGTLVFTSTDPKINWDGTDRTTHQPLPSAHYYYICKVNMIRLHGIESKQVTGMVYIIR